MSREGMEVWRTPADMDRGGGSSELGRCEWLSSVRTGFVLVVPKPAFESNGMRCTGCALDAKVRLLETTVRSAYLC